MLKEIIVCMVESYAVDVQKPIKEQQCKSSILDSDAFCCVCGSSDGDEINCLLEYCQCLIWVNQACYGVLKVLNSCWYCRPYWESAGDIVNQACYGVLKVLNSCWYCRPYRESAGDIVCVLCGYEGGAMTQALRTSIFVKSLFKAWNVLLESRPKNAISSEVWKDKLKLFSIFGFEVDSTRLKASKNWAYYNCVEFGLKKQLGLSCSPSNIKAHNSITARLLDSSVKQWVYLVCAHLEHVAQMVTR